MTIRNLAQLLLTARDLDQEVKISFRDNRGNDITSVSFDGDGTLLLGVSGYNEDRVRVNAEIEIKSPYSEIPQIF